MKLRALLSGSWRHVAPSLDLSKIDCTELARQAAHTEAAALIGRRLSAAGARQTKELRQLHAVYRMNALTAARHREQLQFLLIEFRGQEIEPLLIKGPTVARFYAEPGLRPEADIDLCVAPEQFPAAMQVLRRNLHLASAVDLHEGIPDLPDRTWAQTGRRSKTLQVGAAAVRILCLEDQVRLLCHHQVRHGCVNPMMLCDLAATLEAIGDDFDWDYCLTGWRRLIQWTLCTIGVASKILGAEFAWPTIRQRALCVPDRLVHAVERAWETPATNVWPNPIEAMARMRVGPFNGAPHCVWQFGMFAARRFQAALNLAARKQKGNSFKPFSLHRQPWSLISS